MRISAINTSIVDHNCQINVHTLVVEFHIDCNLTDLNTHFLQTTIRIRVYFMEKLISACLPVSARLVFNNGKDQSQSG